jgi:hypothetical protein
MRRWVGSRVLWTVCLRPEHDLYQKKSLDGCQLIAKYLFVVQYLQNSDDSLKVGHAEGLPLSESWFPS